MSDLQTKWVLAFFIYCFIGWVWECCLVSVRNQRWVNRGFLHGPWLPIYGSGALCILIVTSPIQESYPLTFLTGMVSASLLEYTTGATMEKLFHTRYWDYSDQRLNLNGHICLSVSIGWGLCSLALVMWVHPKIEILIARIPVNIGRIIAAILPVIFAIDVTESVHEAMDVRALLASLSQNHSRIADLEEKLKGLTASLRAGAHWRKAPEETSEDVGLEGNLTRRQRIMQYISARRRKKSGMLQSLYEKCTQSLGEIDEKLSTSLSDNERSRLTDIRRAIQDIQSALHSAALDMAARRPRDFMKAFSMLSRNPSAISKQHRLAFEELSDMVKATIHKPRRKNATSENKPDNSSEEQG